MKKEIPRPIISILSDKMPDFETRATLDRLFMYADSPGEVPEGSKQAKVQEWLLRINKYSNEPLTILGKLIEEYMEPVEDETGIFFNAYAKHALEDKRKFKETLNTLLAKYSLTYIQGGIISAGESVSSRDLQKLVKDKDIPAINLEFERALKNVDAEPLEAISASCNILESICKVYIEDEQLDFPKKQTLRELWKIVSSDLNFDPSQLQDEDLKKVISGMFSIVDGISALRTHGSSAHGQGIKMYKPEPRHARFSVNSAHSLALFVLETWNKKKLNI